MSRLYLLFPETNPANQWMCSNTSLQDEASLVTYLKRLEVIIEHLKYENFDGFYDPENVSNCIEHFEILADYYPSPLSRILRNYLSNFANWRPDQLQSANKKYSIHHQELISHTFCENAEHGLNQQSVPNAVLNLNAHYLNDSFIVDVDGVKVNIVSLKELKDTLKWLGDNRFPERNFQISGKHGESKTKTRIVNNKEESPLRVSEAIGKNLLKYAIGLTEKEVFNLDQENGGFIVFKWEGENPQNMYHGYSVGEDSVEIPPKIRKILRERL